MTSFQTLASVEVDELEEGESLVLPPREENITLRKDLKFEDLYSGLDELGRGGYGVVKKCRDKKSGEIFAAKFVQKTARSVKEITQEVSVMNELHHKRIVYLVGAFESAKQLVVVMELITGGELFEKVVEEDDLTEKQVVRYMRQVLFGLQHMHRKNIAHLDLKPENILCVGGGKNGYEELKLIDFGLSRKLDPYKETTVYGGTPEFVSPEVALVEPVTLAADMWSMGVICYVLISGISPFQDEENNDDKTMQNVTKCEWTFEDGEECFDQISDEAKLFIEELLVRSPKDRNTVDECLNHPWFVRVSNEKKLKTQRLKKFLVRRRWQKAANALRAVCRLDMLGQAYARNHGRPTKANRNCNTQEAAVHNVVDNASESLMPSNSSDKAATRVDTVATSALTTNAISNDFTKASPTVANSSFQQTNCDNSLYSHANNCAAHVENINSSNAAEEKVINADGQAKDVDIVTINHGVSSQGASMIVTENDTNNIVEGKMAALPLENCLKTSHTSDVDREETQEDIKGVAKQIKKTEGEPKEYLGEIVKELSCNPESPELFTAENQHTSDDFVRSHVKITDDKVDSTTENIINDSHENKKTVQGLSKISSPDPPHFGKSEKEILQADRNEKDEKLSEENTDLPGDSMEGISYEESPASKLMPQDMSHQLNNVKARDERDYLEALKSSESDAVCKLDSMNEQNLNSSESLCEEDMKPTDGEMITKTSSILKQKADNIVRAQETPAAIIDENMNVLGTKMPPIHMELAEENGEILIGAEIETVVVEGPFAVNKSDLTVEKNDMEEISVGDTLKISDK